MANNAMCKSFAQISGWVLVLVGLIGFFMTDLFGLLTFDTSHNVLHIVLGAISLWLAYKGAEAMIVNWAKWIGVVYLLLGVIGFFTPTLGPIGLELGENIIHLALGAWGAWAGFLSK